jgi:hypothetical protein
MAGISGGVYRISNGGSSAAAAWQKRWRHGESESGGINQEKRHHRRHENGSNIGENIENNVKSKAANGMKNGGWRHQRNQHQRHRKQAAAGASSNQA